MPNPELTEQCGKEMNQFKDGDAHFPCLENLKAGTLLFNVFAVDEPMGVDERETRKNETISMIGKMFLDSEVVKSQFGDNHLQFVHVAWEKELEMLGDKKEEWKNKVNDELMKNSGCEGYLKQVVNVTSTAEPTA